MCKNGWHYSILRSLRAYLVILAIGCYLVLGTAVPDESRKALSREDAIALAEQFVRENGYTDAPIHATKARLDPESLEWTSNRKKRLEFRRNTLRSKAIGIKSTEEGWGVAFDYVSSHPNCRVVTMNADGSGIRIQHQDGIRDKWVGLDEQ